MVNSTKSAENDPGSSQGGGVAYERLSDSPDDNRSDPEGRLDKPKPDLELVKTPAELTAQEASEQIELGNLVLEYHGSKREAPVRPGLSTKYLNEGSEAKGLLLNKKVE